MYHFGTPLYTSFKGANMGECLKMLKAENDKLMKDYMDGTYGDEMGPFWHISTGVVSNNQAELVCEMK